jgi:hypothetical protein
MEFDEIFAELNKRSQPSLVSAPPVSYPISSSSYLKKLFLVRRKALVLFAPTTTIHTMTMVVYPLMPAIQTTKETSPMLKKVALPSSHFTD